MFGFLVGSAVALDQAHVSSGGGMSDAIGQATNGFRGPEGPVAYAGKCSLVWRHHAGQWVMALYSVSSDQPDPGRQP